MLPFIYIRKIKISTYYSAMVLGYVLMIILMLLKERRNKYNLTKFQSLGFATLGLIVGVLGCKILFILESISWIQKKGFTLGGFSFYGAVFLTPILMPIFGKIFKLSFKESLDNSAICIVAMLGTIRIGCYFNGCCGGNIYNIGNFYFSFPTQLIECFCDLLILIHLIKCEKKDIAHGFLYTRFLLLYGLSRFLIEFLRNTEKDWIHLSHAQWFSLLGISIGILFEYKLKKISS